MSIDSIMTDAAGSQNTYSRREAVYYRRDDLERVREDLLGAIEQNGYDKTTTFAIRLALEEALSNAHKHGNKGNSELPINIDFVVDPSAIVLDIADQGPGFDPEAVPDPTQDENVEIPSGRGLVLIRAYMTQVDITPPGNRIRMVYIRPTAE